MPAPSSPRVPSLADIETIARHAEPIARNLRITQAYHELALGVAARAPEAANWCTFATWASRQAGQTIRGEDLARAIEAELGGAEEIGAAVTRLGAALRRVGRVADRTVLVATALDVVSPVRAAERASAAVARGNLKVFDEIGRAFARFLAALDEGADGAAAVALTLRPGPPPDGQDLLRAAFAGYARAFGVADRRARAEQMLLANLRIGLHEQTRLQPEIMEALDAPVLHPREVVARLLARLFPARSALSVRVTRRLADRDGPLREALQHLVDAVRRRVRAVLTEHFMTLALPGGRVRLGSDVGALCPPHLLRPEDAELCALLARIDPDVASPRGSGAEDWADLGQRMHFISELFRARQEDTSLFEPPFDPAQTAALARQA